MRVSITRNTTVTAATASCVISAITSAETLIGFGRTEYDAGKDADDRADRDHHAEYRDDEQRAKAEQPPPASARQLPAALQDPTGPSGSALATATAMISLTARSISRTNMTRKSTAIPPLGVGGRICCAA